MFPDVTFLGLELYDWCLLIGVVLALAVVRIYSDLLKIPTKLQNLIYITAVAAIAAGMGGAILFQSVYHFLKTGVFQWRGMTFYGGLICGAAVFLAGYFAVGKIFCGDLPKQYFFKVTSIAACAIAAAHCIGRIGCLFAGCCYGRETTEWYGIYLPAVGKTVIPTQLFESIFLLLLFIALSILLFKTKISGLGVYLTAYAVFRFCIEFLRSDDRGQWIGSLSPSQFWSIVLFIAGVFVIASPYLFALFRKHRASDQTNDT